MKNKHNQRMYYTPYQIKLPVDFEKNIEISDEVYTFTEVMDHIDLSRYLVNEGHGKGRPRYDSYTLLKVILFAFMENGYVSTRQIEKYCKTDIRYMWLLQDREAPSHMTICRDQCEDCSDCMHKSECCKAKGNRIIRLNEELTSFHAEVINNLNSVQGALLRMNRSIQAEGAYGCIKWNRSYVRARRRGIKGMLLELGMISCGFNLHKYHLKRTSAMLAA